MFRGDLPCQEGCDAGLRAIPSGRHEATYGNESDTSTLSLLWGIPGRALHELPDRQRQVGAARRELSVASPLGRSPAQSHDAIFARAPHY